MNDRNVKRKSYILHMYFLFLIKFILCFKLPVLKYFVYKIEKPLEETSLFLSFFHRFLMQSFPADLNFRPVLKNTSFFTQFFHVLFQQQRFNFFKK